MKINLAVNAPALVAMIEEVVASGTVSSKSEAVNVLLRELLDCRSRTGTGPPPKVEAPMATNDESERLSWE